MLHLSSNFPAHVCLMRRRARVATTLAIALLGLGLAGCSSVGTQSGAPVASDTLTPTADAAVRSTPVVPGRPARVFVFTGFGDSCEPLPAPQIAVTHPPSKGDVSFVPGQETTIAASAHGTCVGQKAKGTGVYYTARSGEQGTDRFSVSAKLASGETTTRTFEVHIAE